MKMKKTKMTAKIKIKPFAIKRKFLSEFFRRPNAERNADETDQDARKKICERENKFFFTN